MLRHMDAAWDVSGGKRVLGLMIVEGRGGADAITPDKHWLPKRTLNCWKKPCRTVFLTETLPNVSGSQTDSWE